MRFDVRNIKDDFSDISRKDQESQKYRLIMRQRRLFEGKDLIRIAEDLRTTTFVHNCW